MAEFQTLPALPLKNSVLFPNLLIPLVVSRRNSVAAVEAALSREDKELVVFTQKDASTEEPREADLYPVGTIAVIKKMVPTDGTLHVVVQGVERVRMLGITQEKPYLNARVRTMPLEETNGTEVEASHRAMLEVAERMLDLVQPDAKINLNYIIQEVDDPVHQAYLLASVLSLDLEQEIGVLAAQSLVELFEMVYRVLNHEVQVLELRNRIAEQVQSQLGREEREHLLRRQMRAIQEELGEQRPEQADVAEFRRRLEESELPEEVRKEVGKELTRLERMSAASPDYQLTRTYVELALDLPWNNTTDDNLDLQRAWQVLDEDHFDLKEIKQRIVEHLAVMKLNPKAKAPILCFVGPPGVGKTSLGQSIARALGRKFERMSLGGLHDEAELRGHRRTYIGAMPGRIIQAIRRAGVKNPLLMLDEVDKLGRDFRGDPAAALMEILDPAQNFEFHDNYLDLPFDLSKVFFITTANTLDSIPGPLLDRMELLRLAGYTEEEKLQIARRYLLPRQVGQAGLDPTQLTVPDETLSYMARRYTREAGVRELERTLGRVCRRIATRVAQGETAHVAVTPESLAEWIGPEQFYTEEARRESAPGVAAGLAWTQTGGEVIYVEAVLLPEAKDLILTGQLGAVMQESARAAQSYMWSHADDLGIDKLAVRGSGVHIHVPAGAVPKDGPSAGVTMVVALASLYSHAPVRNDTAMTGEITLSGLVMPVGGIKEKVLAAHRAGLRRIILPKANMKDLIELPEQVKEQMSFIPAERIEDLLAGAIPEIAKRLSVTV